MGKRGNRKEPFSKVIGMPVKNDCGGKYDGKAFSLKREVIRGEEGENLGRRTPSIKC